MAKLAVDSGVGRIFIDLEILGKHKRQGHRDTFISKHTVSDISKVRAAVPGAELLVRLNPLGSQTGEEISNAVNSGSDILMLPMFCSVTEVETFCELVDGRNKILPLVETPKALRALSDIIALQPVSEIYLGLNDLHLAFEMKHMFEPLGNGMVDSFAHKATGGGKPFGFGGIARMDEGSLPGSLVLAEHLRLNSSSVILSRTFCRQDDTLTPQESAKEFCNEVAKLRRCEKFLSGRSRQRQELDRQTVKELLMKFSYGA